MSTERMHWWVNRLIALGIGLVLVQLWIRDWRWGLGVSLYVALVVFALALCKAAADSDRAAKQALTQKPRSRTIASRRPVFSSSFGGGAVSAQGVRALGLFTESEGGVKESIGRETIHGAAFSLPERDLRPRSCVFFAGDNIEMLRIAPDGFYVRGQKLDQDESEARAVYKAIVEWLNSQGLRA